MSRSLVHDPVELVLFVYWVNERHKISLAKGEGLPRPWTTDVILDRHHFCNVHREKDRGTIDLSTLQRELAVPREELPKYWAAARMFNLPRTVQIYWLEGVEGVRRAQEQGNKIFNTAYLVSTCGKAMGKVDYVDMVVKNVEAAPIDNRSCRGAFNALRTVDGLGSFMCGQIVADLKHTPYLSAAPDKKTFAVMGPGSKKGLDVIFGRGTTEDSFMSRLTKLRELTEGHIPEVDNQNLQNCLCEFSKYSNYSKKLSGRTRYYR